LKLVTICIPIYNNERTISETLESLLNQSYQNIKIKIFDNASTDKTNKIISDYATRHSNIEIIRNEKNIGGEANFTKCIQGGEGDYTAVFHADDVYMSTMVEEQVLFLETHKDCSCVATHAYYIDEKSNITGERVLPEEFSSNKFNKVDFEELFYLTLKYANIITCPSVMARTNLYTNEIKIWNGAKFQTAADLDVWLRLSRLGKLGFINTPLMKYRYSSDSYSYRIEAMCLRIERQDLFLVLDYYINNNILKLSSEEKYLYNMLSFLDVLHVNVNKYLNNRTDYEKNINLKFSFSKRIFYYKLVNLIFNVVKYIPLSNGIKKILIELKGKS